MNQTIDLPMDSICAFCHKSNVSELALFGSILREDFRPDSDVDVLVRFSVAAPRYGLLDMVRMEQELQEILGRRVDLTEKEAAERSENYIRRRAILESAEVIYAA